MRQAEAGGSLVLMIAWSRLYRGRLGAEIAVAFVVGAVAFATVALISAAARDHVPGALLGFLLIVAVLVVAYLGGVVFAVPVGLASIVAFDWYFLPPTHPVAAPNTGSVLALAVFILTSVLVGEVAAAARRRADHSEQARGVLADEQAALRRVATLVASQQPSPAEVFAAVTKEVGQLFPVDIAAMHVYEGDGTATTVAGWSERGPMIPAGTSLSLDGESVVAFVYRTRAPARINGYEDATGSTAEVSRGLGLRTTVGAPIIVDGQLWGAMVVASRGLEPLPVGVEGRLEGFTNLIATAVSNAEARGRLERVAAEQAALRRVATLVAGGMPPTAVFAEVAARVAELFGAPYVGLVRLEADRTVTLVAASDRFAGDVGLNWSYSADADSFLLSVLREGRAARIDDAELPVPGAHGSSLGAGSMVCAPIVVDGRPWGAVAVGSPKDQPRLPADTADRLAGFTELVATAISNSEARTEVRQLADEQAGLRRVATLVAQGLAPADIFSAVADEFARVFDVDAGFVARFEQDDTATIVATSGVFYDERAPLGSTWPLDDDSVRSRVFRTGAPARVDEALPEGGTKSTAGAPIVIGDRVWGVAAATSLHPDGLPPDTEARLGNFADLIATAVSNAATRTELTASRARVVAAADEARRKLERDLHDGIQQQLVSLALDIRRAETVVPPGSDGLKRQLSAVEEGLTEALDDLRELSRGIHPAVLSEGGLEPALNVLARRSVVPIDLHVDLDSRLEPRIEVAAYYVASEALANAAKHAAASSVELQVARRDGHLDLSIRDDGVGGADPGRGSGLIGLRDRVEALGGTITIVSPAGAGTSLHVQLPVE